MTHEEIRAALGIFFFAFFVGLLIALCRDDYKPAKKQDDDDQFGAPSA